LLLAREWFTLISALTSGLVLFGGGLYLTSRPEARRLRVASFLGPRHPSGDPPPDRGPPLPEPHRGVYLGAGHARPDGRQFGHPREAPRGNRLHPSGASAHDQRLPSPTPDHTGGRRSVPRLSRGFASVSGT